MLYKMNLLNKTFFIYLFFHRCEHLYENKNHYYLNTFDMFLRISFYHFEIVIKQLYISWPVYLFLNLKNKFVYRVLTCHLLRKVISVIQEKKRCSEAITWKKLLPLFCSAYKNIHTTTILLFIVRHYFRIPCSIISNVLLSQQRNLSSVWYAKKMIQSSFHFRKKF